MCVCVNLVILVGSFPCAVPRCEKKKKMWAGGGTSGKKRRERVYFPITLSHTHKQQQHKVSDDQRYYDTDYVRKGSRAYTVVVQDLKHFNKKERGGGGED